MTDWTSGYVADIDYTYGYYPDINFLRAKLALTNAGVVMPKIKTACELGYGQGLSANFHAAATDVEWYGTDFNPAQAGFAKELAAINGKEANFYDESFEEFCAREELPSFDLIALHGIWSWISPDNRDIICDFIKRKLNVGGLVYISYNTYPGWTAFAPMRHLMTKHAEIIGAQGKGLSSRIDAALEYSKQLVDIQPGFVRANPNSSKRLEQMTDKSRHYLAHEFFNRDWHPMYFSDMADYMDGAKLEFACSAFYLDHVPSANFTTEQTEFLSNIPNPILAESTKDFIVNQQFRRDLWIKGARKISALERVEIIQDLRIILIAYSKNIELKLSGPQGELNLDQNVYGNLIGSLSDYKPRTVRELNETLQSKGVTLSQLVQAILVLGSQGHITIAQDSESTDAAKPKTKKINEVLINKSVYEDKINFLVSPVSGGGIPVGRLSQLFIRAMSAGMTEDSEIAENVYQVLARQGQSLIKDNKQLQTPEENRAELIERIKLFRERLLPILVGLEICKQD